MLLQSQDGEIHLLPALPKEIPTGSVKGLCARGGFVVDMTWVDGLLQTLNILSRNGGECKVSINDQVAKANIEKEWTFSTDINQTYTYEF